MDSKFKRNTAIVFACIVAAFLVLGLLLNLTSVIEPLEEYQNDTIDYTALIGLIKSGLLKDVVGKEAYINLNGLYAKMTGRKIYNDVAVLKNGMLTTGRYEEIDVTKLVSAICTLDTYLKESSIEHLYVQAPYKVDVEGQLLYAGTVHCGNKNANKLLDGLNKQNVSCYDLRPYFSQTPELVNKYFYKTDHHWNNDGAFEAFGLLLKQINERFPNANIDMTVADKSNWNVEVFENCFLGSNGKRVGVYYGGMDDFAVYTPKMETNMTVCIENGKIYTGSFDNAIVTHKQYITNTDYFNQTAYWSYLGKDYSVVRMNNANAKSDLKIVFIKDSYTTPVSCFMTTAFKEVTIIDPRYVSNYSVAEYIEAIQPDMVITMLNPSVFTNSKYYGFGVEEARKHMNQVNGSVVLEQDTFRVTAGADEENTNKSVIKKISSNIRYRVSFEDVKFLKGSSEAITVGVYNATTKKLLTTEVLDLDLCRQRGEFVWDILSPTIKDGDDVRLIIYAGVRGETNGNDMEIINLKVEKFS